MIAMHGRAMRAPRAALLLAVLLPFLSATVPLLDRGDGWYAPVLAPEQGYPSGAVAHDHSICVRFAANATLVSAPTGFRFIQSLASIPDLPRARPAPARLRVRPRSRSPPIV
ncbi:MAG: hypothetical protein PVH00_10340 [Gemmatimonadota bacterium]|jgi:hypothetical protein